MKTEELLDMLLVEIKQGKSIEDCLREYPDRASELEPLLRVAVELQCMPKPVPDPNLVNRVVADAQRLRQERKMRERFSFSKIFVFQPAFVRVFAAIALLFLIGWTSLTLSAQSLPGETMYPVKLFAEKVEYSLTRSAEGRIELHIKYANRRTNEFLQTFKEDIPLNRVLCENMLSEVEKSLEQVAKLDNEKAAILLRQIIQCNQHQMSVLKTLKTQACECDQDFLTKAIQTCRNRHRCDRCLDKTPFNEDHPCQCEHEK